MKKIVSLVAVCVLAMIIVFIPAGKALYNSYQVSSINKEIIMRFMTASESGYSVQADNNGQKYILAPGNYERVCDLLCYAKVVSDGKPSDEDKKVIKLKFSDGVVISVINHDEKADVSCVVIDYGENTEYYTVEGLGLYKWLDEVIDEDGFRTPNKVLPKLDKE